MYLWLFWCFFMFAFVLQYIVVPIYGWFGVCLILFWSLFSLVFCLGCYVSFSGLVGFVFSPHLCVGFLFLIVRSCPLLLPPASRRLAHNHTTYSHTTYSHTTYSHTHTAYSHTSHARTHNLLTHTQLTHTHTRTQLTHPQLTYTQLPHAQLSRTQTFTLRGRRVLGDVKLHFVWQAWHWWRWAGSGGALGSCLSPWTPRLTLCGRPGAWRRRSSVCVAGVALMVLGWLWWRAWFPFVPEDAAAVCVAGVAFGSIGLHSVRQAWHLATSAWQAWRLWCWAGSGGALGSRLSPRTRRLFVWQAWHLEASASILCGRRGAWQHRPSLCVAGVALMALGWLWWRAWLQLFLEESTSILCGRPGAWRHRPSLCVASVALMVLRWSADPLSRRWPRRYGDHEWVARLVPVCRRGSAAVCVAGVAFGSIGLHSVW